MSVSGSVSYIWQNQKVAESETHLKFLAPLRVCDLFWGMVSEFT